MVCALHGGLQSANGVEVSCQHVEQRSGFGRVCGEQFGKGELHVVFADDPRAQFGGGRVSACLQCVPECFAAEESAPEGGLECGVAGAPCAQQSQADEGAGYGAIVCREWCGEGEDLFQQSRVVGNDHGRVLANRRNIMVPSASYDDASEETGSEIGAGAEGECEQCREVAGAVVNGCGGQQQQVPTGAHGGDRAIPIGIW